MDTKILGEFLRAGYINEGVYYDTTKGAAQGGIISPILANITLDGIKHLLDNQFKSEKVHYVRYADDWVVTAETRETAEQVKTLIEEFLIKRGLSLSVEKTKIVHIDEGFNFLSWNFRKFQGKLLIKPSSKAVAMITHKLSDIIHNAKSICQDDLIEKLNPLILGWSLYHRNFVSADTFKRLDFIIWDLLWHWAKRRHPDKGYHWIVRRYWHSVDNSNWVFTTFKFTLVRFSQVKIKRHILVQLRKNPFLDAVYFENRNCDKMTKQMKFYSSFNAP